MTMKIRRLVPLAVLPLALALTAADAGAAPKKAASPFQGFSSDSGKPVDVKSDSLEVHQDEQKAVFTGNVVATQGDSTLRTNELTVFYENVDNNANGAAKDGKAKDAKAADAKPADPKAADAKPADAKPADGQPAGDAKTTEAKPADTKPADTSKAPASGSGTPASSIKKLVARGNVVVTSKDQKATGNNGVMDMATNIATLSGGEVVMIQGPNVLKGTKLTVNLKTGIAKVEGGGGGVSGVFTQGSQKKSN
ncbi:organic solvent tolerance protein OstA [Labrys sp. LIt4]|uniref:LptA/OstA family protein n=1 Tax=Labrys sp. LIt4 TaxID=2821355 RepID=UPI001ADFF841|nr:LptA/OstA family protein [Labrys sp. LIt4]MBP0579795.1 organic solvent tolerance protein OstA [Labrys sp. LIt4]